MLVACSSSSSSSCSSMQRHLLHIRPTNIHQLGVCVILSLSACAKRTFQKSISARIFILSSHMHHHPPPPFSTHCSLSMFKPFYLVTSTFLCLLFLLCNPCSFLFLYILLFSCFPSFKDLVFQLLCLLTHLAKRTFRQIYKIKSYAHYLFQGRL